MKERLLPVAIFSAALGGCAAQKPAEMQPVALTEMHVKILKVLQPLGADYTGEQPNGDIVMCRLIEKGVNDTDAWVYRLIPLRLDAEYKVYKYPGAYCSYGSTSVDEEYDKDRVLACVRATKITVENCPP